MPYSKAAPLPDSLSNEEWSNSGVGAISEPADAEIANDGHAEAAGVSDSQSYVVFFLCDYLFVIVVFPVFKTALARLMGLCCCRVRINCWCRLIKICLKSREFHFISILFGIYTLCL